MPLFLSGCAHTRPRGVSPPGRLTVGDVVREADQSPGECETDEEEEEECEQDEDDEETCDPDGGCWDPPDPNI